MRTSSFFPRKQCSCYFLAENFDGIRHIYIYIYLFNRVLRARVEGFIKRIQVYFWNFSLFLAYIYINVHEIKMNNNKIDQLTLKLKFAILSIVAVCIIIYLLKGIWRHREIFYTNALKTVRRQLKCLEVLFAMEAWPENRYLQSTDSYW
jgi:ABC-type multidrug transport system permease subunit